MLQVGDISKYNRLNIGDSYIVPYSEPYCGYINLAGKILFKKIFINRRYIKYLKEVHISNKQYLYSLFKPTRMTLIEKM